MKRKPQKLSGLQKRQTQVTNSMYQKKKKKKNSNYLVTAESNFKVLLLTDEKIL